MEQIQIGLMLGDELFFWQARHRVLCGETGDVKRGLHRAFNGSFGEIRGARVAATVADINRDAQRFIAVAFNVFEFAFANRHAQTTALRSLGGGIGGAKPFSVVQCAVNLGFELDAAVAESGQGFVVGGRGY